ncbi:MAG TPA: SWIM zinc finger family protein, partial [Acetobacteraceae bacterium]|nr:SWIM zinc finger family protein [Acetobacteraceae bacterium]
GYYEQRWPEYVPVAERRRRAELAMEKLRKKGHPVAPVTLESKKIATTFWGKAWCDNLEGYADFASRIERGRTYVRNGSVVDLQIAPREVTAIVSGSELYNVKISISEVAKPHWARICRDCTGGIDSLVELLQGRFSNGVMERICRQQDGLFPRPAEIRFTCSCPDWADMCKHVAAVLYGIGARLDQQPELLFRLRAVDENALVAGINATVPLSKGGPAADKVLAEDDLSALFGLDMEQREAAPEPNEPVARGAEKRSSASRKKPLAKPAKPVVAKPAQARAATKETAPPTPAVKRGRPIAAGPVSPSEPVKSRAKPASAPASRRASDPPTSADGKVQRARGAQRPLAKPTKSGGGAARLRPLAAGSKA